ncbi:MAG: 50S ribosomal protein L31 [Microgenomates group bacterium]|nr:50S ribosomal protein L31 [Microgenomates group bacterium]
MKKNIHPKYFDQAKVVCSCGNTFTIGSTKESITVEVCNRCHPFYTGEHRYLDTKGRVDAFQKKAAAAAQIKLKRGNKKEKKELKEEKRVKSLKELLSEEL